MGVRYVIVGNGVAGATAALEIRARDPDGDITMVSDEGPYFFSRTALMYAFMDALDRRDMEPFERKVWAERRIARVQGRVTDLDADARALTLSDGRAVPYDKLLLATGSTPRRLRVDGVDDALKGRCHFVTLQDLDACERWARDAREAVVVGGGLIGIELVECLMHHGVKTTFLVREPWYWPIALCREEGELIAAHMRHHGVDVRTTTELASVARGDDGRVRAVTTTAGETLPCQFLGVAIGVEPQCQWLRDVKTPPTLGRGIVVDARLRTSLPHVWSAGDCAELHLGEGRAPAVEQIWYSAKRQGTLAGRAMTGQAPAYAPPTFFNSAKFFDVEYTTVGDLLNLPTGAKSLFRAHPTEPISQRIVHHEGRVLGFNLLGSRWDHTVLTAWIESERPVDWVVAHLAEARFDVEFGGVDLGAMTERTLDVVAARAVRS